MRTPILRILFAAALSLAVSVASPQTHKVAKPQEVVRAVGVYEWTGDFAKPTASRLIPVSVFIQGKFEDAGVYIARPIPFALLPGNLYILQSAGLDKATLDLAYAKHLQAVEPTGDLAYDDGWFGYGSVKPLAAPRKTTPATLKPSKTLPVITTSADPNRPHFGSKPADPASSNGSDQSKPDQSKPDTTTSNTTTPSTSTSDDPNRPTMKRRTPDPSTPPTTTTTPAPRRPAPADPLDPPTLHSHPP